MLHDIELPLHQNLIYWLSPTATLEQSLRAIWDAAFRAAVLILLQIKLNSQLSSCTSFLIDSIKLKLGNIDMSLKPSIGIILLLYLGLLLLLLLSRFSLSDSMWSHRWQPTRLPHPWNSLGKNTGVGCHFPLQCVKMKSESEVAQSCQTLSNPMDCSLPGSAIHGIFQARVLEWSAIAFSGT